MINPEQWEKWSDLEASAVAVLRGVAATICQSVEDILLGQARGIDACPRFDIPPNGPMGATGPGPFDANHELKRRNHPPSPDS